MCWIPVSSYALKPGSSSAESCEDTGDGFEASPSACGLFLLLESLTTHSTSSRRQLVQGVPLSTTSHRTFRERQQWQALEARRFTVRPLAGRPAARALRFAVGWPEAAGTAGAMVCWGEKDLIVCRSCVSC